MRSSGTFCCNPIVGWLQTQSFGLFDPPSDYVTLVYVLIKNLPHVRMQRGFCLRTRKLLARIGRPCFMSTNGLRFDNHFVCGGRNYLCVRTNLSCSTVEPVKHNKLLIPRQRRCLIQTTTVSLLDQPPFHTKTSLLR